MSASTTPDLDLREQLVRIDRAIAETRKFQAEADKFRRDRFLAPFLAFGVLSGAVGGLLTLLLRGVH